MVAVTIFWLIEKAKESYGKTMSILTLSAILYIFSAYALLSESTRFKKQLAEIDPSLSSELARPQWSDGGSNTDRSASSFSSHLQQHAQYYRLARTIASKSSAISSKEEFLLAYVPSHLFSESLLAPASLHYIGGLNYHNVFLALYLNDLGFRSGWILMLDRSRSYRQLGRSFGAPREYSAPVFLNTKGNLAYRDPDNILGFIRFDGPPNKMSGIVTTTVEELQFAKQWLTKSGVQYREVKVDEFH